MPIEFHRINMKRLAEYVEDHAPPGGKTLMKARIGHLLWHCDRYQDGDEPNPWEASWDDDSGAKRRWAGHFDRRVGKQVQLPDPWLDALWARIHGTDEPGMEGIERPAEPQKVKGSLLSQSGREGGSQEAAVGRAELGEIQIVDKGENLLNEEDHGVAAAYTEVFVDEVRFRQDVGEDRVEPRRGQYIRIAPKSRKHGAVVLPVDTRSERVLLVHQHRHPQRKFLVEAPRGFSSVSLDSSERDTARRELMEETGYAIREMSTGERLAQLGALYTDTGKLWEKPHYFLAEVGDEQRERRRETPVMESIVWVDIRTFYRSVFAPEPLTGLTVRGPEECSPEELDADEILIDKGTASEKFQSKADIWDGDLSIEDGFTTLVAQLALPHLVRPDWDVDFDWDFVAEHWRGRP